MSSSPRSTEQGTDRRLSESASIEMAPALKRSSRDWSASALEADRKARLEADRQRQLQAQVEALQTQLKEAAENEKRNSEQASVERQAAKDQEFYEISLTKQESFRMMLSEEVFARVAQKLESDGNLNQMRAIEGGNPELRDSTTFKTLLWEAIAGNDQDFIRQAAGKVANRYKSFITDEDISAITNSTSCLDSDTIESVRQTNTCGEIAGVDAHVTAANECLDHFERGTLPASITPEPVLEQPSISVVDTQWVKKETSEQIENGSNAMDRLEEEYNPLTQVDSTRSNALTSIQLVDVLDNSVTTHGAAAIDHENGVPSAGPFLVQALAPMTPSSPSMERVPTSEQTPSPGELGSPSPLKGTKNSASKKSGKVAVGKFREHIETSAKKAELHESELACSKCSKEARDPRFSTKCHHIYCFGCWKAHMKGATGKEANKVMCCYEGCKKTLGAMRSISADEIKELREAYVRSSD